MLRSRLGLKVLGLCALALGLMAFASSAAQAEVGAHWNIINSEGKLIEVNETTKLFAQFEIKELEKKTATLLFTTKAGTKVAILCSEAKFDEGGQMQPNGGISLGRILFSGPCVVFLNEKLASGCQAHTKGKANGEILTEKATGLIVLDKLESGEVDEFVRFIPDPVEGVASPVFARIEMGPECAIGELVKVEEKGGAGSAEGGLWIKDCGKINEITGECEESNKSFLEEKVEHLITESLHGLIALGQPAVIDGSAFVRLSGEHLGLKWGGTPG